MRETDIQDYLDDLTAVTAEKERISTELNVAAKIRPSMLPCVFPPYPERGEFDIYAAMTPAKEVGGDLYAPIQPEPLCDYCRQYARYKHFCR